MEIATLTSLLVENCIAYNKQQIKKLTRVYLRVQTATTGFVHAI